MQFMLAPYPHDADPFTAGDPARAADVLNNSWGCPQDEEGCDPASLRPAVAALESAGIFVVASAGNSGPDCGSVTDPPAIYADALSVGAIDQFADLADFSSEGPVTVDGSNRIKPDLLAPGVDVLSAFPGGTYTKLDGTSMAGPHVAGVVALMWSANPALIGQVELTRRILLETATPFTGTLAATMSLDVAGDVLNPNAPTLTPAVTPAVTATVMADNTTVVHHGACLYRADLAQVPNNAAGYGIVNAYAAVRRAQALGSAAGK